MTLLPFPRMLASLALAVVLAAFLPSVARAERYALLVGVSEYVHKDAWNKLNGPPNDIPALYQALLKRGFAPGNITVLIDHLGPDGAGIQPKGLPTRAAIRAEFARLSQTVRQGDEVFVLLSGHGDRQFAADLPASGGRPAVEYVYIPIDAGPDTGPRADDSPIENGLLHTEIAAFLDRMRELRTETWMVLDTCHSGGLTRGFASDLPARPTAQPVVRTPSLGGGGVVAFMAAQKTDEVFEVQDVSVSTGNGAMSYGPLSLLVARVLASSDTPTYAEAARRVLAGYQFYRNKSFNQPTTPLFEGELERPILGRDMGAEHKRWTAMFDPFLTGKPPIVIQAGRLEGLEPGREILLWGSTTEAERKGLAPPEVVGRAVIERVELLRSFARQLGPDTAALPSELRVEFAEPVSPTRLRVARPAGSAASAPEPAWLTSLAGRLAFDDQVRLVGFDEDADYRIVVDPLGAWVIPAASNVGAAAAIGGSATGLSQSPEDVANQLATQLLQFAQRDRLLRLAEAATGSPSSRFLQIQLMLLRAPDLPARAPGGTPAACPKAPPQPPEAATPVPAESIPDLQHCDTLYVRLTNSGRNPLDLGLCFVDGAGRVQTADSLMGVRIMPREQTDYRALPTTSWDRRAARPSAGPSRLVIMAVERQLDNKPTLPFPLQVSSAVCPRTMETRALAADNATPQERGLLAALRGARGGTRGDLAPAASTLDGSIVRLLKWNQLLAP